MINLLPDAKKAEIRAGRVNVTLVKFIIMTLSAAALCGILLSLAYFVLVQARDETARKAVDSTQKLANYSADKQAIQAFTSNIDGAKKIIDKQISYSRIFIAIGHALPRDAVVDTLNIAPENFSTGLTMQVHSRTKEAMVEVKNNMQKNPEVFKDVSFESVDFESCKNNGSYSCTATLHVIFNEKVRGQQP